MEKKTLKVEDYGDMFAKVLQMDLIVYRAYGSYSGSWIAVLQDEKRVFFYKDYYGSCSGCDWLEAEKDWKTGEVDAESAIQYVGDIKPAYILPLSLAKRLGVRQIEDLLQGYDLEYSDEKEEVIKDIKEGLSKLLESK